MQTSTGFGLVNSDKIFGVVFDDDRCPICGNKMTLNTMKLKGIDINVRYICDNCGLILPIKHDEHNLPCYDLSIKNFLNSFGEDIRIRRFKV